MATRKPALRSARAFLTSVRTPSRSLLSVGLVVASIAFAALSLRAALASPSASPPHAIALPARADVPPSAPATITTPYVVLAWNDLGMHCMNSDFSEIMILPPYNTLHAQLIRRGNSPDIDSSSGDFEVRYLFPDSTHAADKTNFWDYWQPLFGAALPPEIGLAGNRLAGSMAPTGNNDWAVVGVPLVPLDDFGKENPYPLALIQVRNRNTNAIVARTQAVAPVSTEISCNLCHNSPGVSTAVDLLTRHDNLHGTQLVSQQPVLCADCHSSNALAAPGQPGLPSLSGAIHASHADRMDAISLPNNCYACHPGVRTDCQRDLHAAAGVTCTACHGDMAAVGNPARQPWIDEPRCDDCHSRPGFDFEQPNTLYRNSKGHGNVHCAACHGSPHAMGPAITQRDNVQANLLQGHSGVINDCTVCHGAAGPPGQFFHSQDD